MSVTDRSITCWESRQRRCSAAGVNDRRRIASVHIAASSVRRSRTAHHSVVRLSQLSLSSSAARTTGPPPLRRVWRAILKLRPLRTTPLSAHTGDADQLHRLRPTVFQIQRPPPAFLSAGADQRRVP